MTGEGPRDAAMASDEDERGLGLELAEELRDVMDEVLLALGDHLDETEKRLARARAHKSKTPLSWDECLSIVQQVRRDVQRARESVPRPNPPQPTPDEDRLATGAMAEHLKRRLREGATLEQVVGELGGGGLAALLPAPLFEPGVAKVESARLVATSASKSPTPKAEGRGQARSVKKPRRSPLMALDKPGFVENVDCRVGQGGELGFGGWARMCLLCIHTGGADILLRVTFVPNPAEATRA
jgi:hypothetical protein